MGDSYTTSVKVWGAYLNCNGCVEIFEGKMRKEGKIGPPVNSGNHLYLSPSTPSGGLPSPGTLLQMFVSAIAQYAGQQAIKPVINDLIVLNIVGSSDGKDTLRSILGEQPSSLSNADWVDVIFKPCGP